MVEEAQPLILAEDCDGGFKILEHIGVGRDVSVAFAPGLLHFGQIEGITDDHRVAGLRLTCPTGQFRHLNQAALAVDDDVEALEPAAAAVLTRLRLGDNRRPRDSRRQ